MNHTNEDTLLKLVLHILDDEKKHHAQEHLVKCTKCQAQYEKVKTQTELLGSLSPQLDTPLLPMAAHTTRTWIRVMHISAILVIGFIAGLFFSDYLFPCGIHVVEQQFIVKYSTTSYPDFTVCEQVDIGVE